MKKIILLAFLFLSVGVISSQAQIVRARIEFPVGVSVRAPGPPPFAGAIWVGPEWAWRGGRYEVVKGYWARPRRHRGMWVPGHWGNSRRGYKWIPGHWR